MSTSNIRGREFKPLQLIGGSQYASASSRPHMSYNICFIGSNYQKACLCSFLTQHNRERQSSILSFAQGSTKAYFQYLRSVLISSKNPCFMSHKQGVVRSLMGEATQCTGDTILYRKDFFMEIRILLFLIQVKLGCLIEYSNLFASRSVSKLQTLFTT